MFCCLNFDRAIGSPTQKGNQSLAVLRLLVWLSLRFSFEHGEVIRHDEPNLLIRPVTGGIGILDGLTFALPNDRESQLSETKLACPGASLPLNFSGSRTRPKEYRHAKPTTALGGYRFPS